MIDMKPDLEFWHRDNSHVIGIRYYRCNYKSVTYSNIVHCLIIMQSLIMKA